MRNKIFVSQLNGPFSPSFFFSSSYRSVEPPVSWQGTGDSTNLHCPLVQLVY